jgi:hypothetical protein
MKTSTTYEVRDSNGSLLTGGKILTKAKTEALEWAKDYPDKARFPFKIFAVEEKFMGSFDNKGKTTSISLNYTHEHVEVPEGWSPVLKGKPRKGDKAWNIEKNRWEKVGAFHLKYDFQAPYDFYALIRKTA